MAAVAKKCYYTNTSKIILFYFYSRFGHSMVNGMFKLVSQRNTRSSESKKSKEVYWLWRLREVFDGQSIR